MRWWECCFVVMILPALVGCMGDAARDVTLADALASSALTSISDDRSANNTPLRGPLVIAFWATWCAPCRSEMPALERLSQRLRERGINVIGITLDDDLNLAREFVRSHRLTFPVYAEGGDPVLRSTSGVKTLPHTVLVTGDGTVAASLRGARDWDAPAMERRVLMDVLGLAHAASTETDRGVGMRRRVE